VSGKGASGAGEVEAVDEFHGLAAGERLVVQATDGTAQEAQNDQAPAVGRRGRIVVGRHHRRRGGALRHGVDLPGVVLLPEALPGHQEAVFLRLPGGILRPAAKEQPSSRGGQPHGLAVHLAVLAGVGDGAGRHVEDVQAFARAG